MDDDRLELEWIAEKTLERLSALAVDLTVIKSTYATKEDVVKMEGMLCKWFIGIAVALAGMAFAAARFI